MADRIHLRALRSGLPAHGLLAVEGVPPIPTVGLYLSRNDTPNGDCGIVFERK
jgi:hypothetical protein